MCLLPASPRSQQHVASSEVTTAQCVIRQTLIGYPATDTLDWILDQLCWLRVVMAQVLVGVFVQGVGPSPWFFVEPTAVLAVRHLPAQTSGGAEPSVRV